MISKSHHGAFALRGAILLAVFLLTALYSASCTYYRDPRAEVIITSSRDGATIYLVPTDKQVPKPPTQSALKEYAIGTTPMKPGVWVNHGIYWLVLEKDGTWSQPIEFEIRLDCLNKVHVEF